MLQRRRKIWRGSALAPSVPLRTRGLEKRGNSRARGTGGEGREAPWVNCAASLSHKLRRKSVSVSFCFRHVWVGVAGGSSRTDMLVPSAARDRMHVCHLSLCVCVQTCINDCVSYRWTTGVLCACVCVCM